MKRIYLLLMVLSSLLYAEIKVGERIEPFTVNDQFDKSQSITQDTKKIIFVFSKQKGHDVRDFLSKQEDGYLTKRDILFVADVSKMPAIIRWFVLDSLDEYKFSIVLIEDKDIASKYKNENRADQIMVVGLNNFNITGVDYTDDVNELKTLIENN